MKKSMFLLATITVLGSCTQDELFNEATPIEDAQVTNQTTEGLTRLVFSSKEE